MLSRDGDIGIPDLDLEEGVVLACLVGHRSAVHGDRLQRGRMHPPGAVGQFTPHRDEPENAVAITAGEGVGNRLDHLKGPIGLDGRDDVVGRDPLGVSARR